MAEVAGASDGGGSRGRKRVLRIVKLLLVAVLFGLLIALLDMREAARTLASARPAPLMAAFAAMLAVHVARSAIFVFLVRPFARVRVSAVFAYTLVGAFFSNFLPSQMGGDIVKGLYIGKMMSSLAHAYAAIVVHRLAGLAGTMSVACAAVAWIAPGPWSLAPAGVFGAALAAGFAGVYLLRGRSIEGAKARLPRRLKHLGALLDALWLYRGHAGRVAASCLFSVAPVFLGVLVYYFCVCAVGLPMTFGHVLFASAATQLSVLVPLTPGGLGVGEASFVGVAEVLGYAPAPAFAAILLARLVRIAATLLGAPLYLAAPQSYAAASKD